MEDKHRHLPFHSVKAVKYLNKRRMFALLHLMCLLCFFYYRFIGAQEHCCISNNTNVFVTIACSCEVLFALIWVFGRIAVLFPIDREVYPERLFLRYAASQLPPVDVFITTADPLKEPPLILVNTVLSVLAMDYPADKLACYVSDDGASPFTLFSLIRAYDFAKRWVPFCKLFSIEPRAPMAYFSTGTPIQSPDAYFDKEWEELKEGYDKMKRDITTALESRQLPRDAQKMFEELSGYGQPIDLGGHQGMIKVLDKGSDCPLLVYVSREKRPGFKHHYKAGALNALARVSGVLTNSPFILNLDCDMYVNNSKAILQSMCFHLDPLFQAEDRISFVQFPQRFGGIDEDDPYGNKMSSVFDVIMKGLDGLQGPLYCGTGCVHRRRVLYGGRPGSLRHKELQDRDKYRISRDEVMKEKFGHSAVFVASVVEGRAESICVSKDILELISSSYEGGTAWGTEVGWMYGSSTEDVMTGLKQHSRGWKSIYYSPGRPAFIGIAPNQCKDNFQQRKRWSKGLLEILISRNCPLFCGYGGLMFLQRVIYAHYSFYPIYSIPLILYGILPTFSLITEKPFIPMVSDAAIVPFILVFFSLNVSSYVESTSVGISANEWWNTTRMWMSINVTSNIAAILEVFIALVGTGESGFSITPKPTDDKSNGGGAEGFRFDSSAIFVTPTAFVLFNVVGLIVGVVRSVLFRRSLMVGEMCCVAWILINLFPFVRGLFTRHSEGGLPLQTILISACCVSVLCCVAITSAT